MNGDTEMCEIMDLIFSKEESEKHTEVLTSEDYDTIGDLAFTFDRPPSMDQMNKELEEIGLDVSVSKKLIDAIMFIFERKNSMKQGHTLRTGSTTSRPLGRVRFEVDGKTAIARILGDTSIQDRNGRIYGAVSEWLEHQKEEFEKENKDVEPEEPKLNGENLSIPPVPPPGPPLSPYATS